MAADIEHSDALTLLDYLEKSILNKSSFRMTYGDAAQILAGHLDAGAREKRLLFQEATQAAAAAARPAGEQVVRT